MPRDYKTKRIAEENAFKTGTTSSPVFTSVTVTDLDGDRLVYSSSGTLATSNNMQFNDTSNTLDIGDISSGNYLSIDNDGKLTLTGDARVFNSYWVDAGGIKAPGAKPATAVAHGTLETPAWRFADAGAGNENTISWDMKIPHRMDRSVAPTISIGWSSTTLAGNVRWRLEYLWTSEGESTAGAAQETLYVTGALSGVAEGLVVSTFTGIDIPSATDVCIHCRLTRMSAAAEDTVADNVELHGVCFQWTSDKLGMAT